MLADEARLDAVRAAHARVAGLLVDMQALVVREFRRPLTGVTAETEREADGELLRLSCLSLALDPGDDDHAPDGSRLAGLRADPIAVTFTSATGEPVHVEWLALAEAVEAAEQHRATICRLVDAYRAAVRFVEADLDRLRRALATPDTPTGSAGTDDADRSDAPAARLAALARAAALDPVGCGRPGPWRDEVARLLPEPAVAARPAPAVAVRPDPWPPPTTGPTPDAAWRLRSSVARLRRLAAEAAREGLAGGDPLPDLDVEALLDRAAAGPVGVDLTAALDQATEAVDAARRRLRGRCHRELRGRLEAYRQRAADQGRAEHPNLEHSYREARDGLRPDGFAVTAASRAVRAYQQAVNEVIR
ncbi:hypothetical protein O7606_03855 [Micromonospora sp. WMMD882]|uniref:hypothetical protein n=1 Tax=Micromonospora sp. WMMD882 TaxID=3015151 RepID=UPI00248C15D7|nr:hypothetical protein [Micromonospora sp. WMMD882]WBB80532.1 hypothetical protein O7606_03855 [Micromonospora sp. WMMD882]